MAFSAGAFAGGWAMALANAVLASVLWRQAVGPDMRRFLRWGVGANIVRFGAVLAALWGIYAWIPDQFTSFLLGAIPGTWVLGLAESMRLIRRHAGRAG